LAFPTEVLATLAIALSLALLRAVRKGCGRTARRIAGTSILVCSFAAVITWATAACILFLSFATPCNSTIDSTGNTTTARSPTTV